MNTEKSEIVIEIKNLATQIDNTWVHEGLNLSVKRGEILAIVGKSGSGKTMLLRQILSLYEPTKGSINIFGENIMTISPERLTKLQQRCGMLFQHSALFSSLTALENVAFPLHEHMHIDDNTIKELALLKLIAVGLTPDDALKYPNELSGGMQRRVGLARACVMDPELLFLDEPTTGLDPDTAAALDELILNLQTTLGLTVVLVTHDLDTLWTITNRVAFLGDKRVLAVAPMKELVHSTQPLIHEFFAGSRATMATASYEKKSE